MLKTTIIKYAMIILTCFLCACSQSPSNNDSQHTGQVSGKINLGDITVQQNTIQIRAYQYQSNQWQDNEPVNSTYLNNDGSYIMNLPEDEYIISLFVENQNGPEFFYEIYDDTPCKNYQLLLRDIDDDIIVSSYPIVCSPETIWVHYNEMTSNVDFDIQNTGNIIGQVTNANGEPISLVTITAYYEEKVYAQTQTNQNGDYTLTYLPEGDYRIMAETKANYVNKYFNSANYLQDADAISVIAGDVRKNTNIQLTRGGIISGIVTDANNTPLPNVMVTAIERSQNRKTGKSLASDADGSYTIYGLPPGQYILYALSPNTEYVSCYFKSAYSIDNATYISIYSEGDIKNGNNFDLQHPGQLIATLIEKETGNLIEDDRIFAKIYRASDNELIKIVSSSRGVIQADGLLEGKYKFEIVTEGTRYAPAFYSDKKTLQNAWEVQIDNGKAEDDVRFELQTGGSLSGRVIENQNSTVLVHYTVLAISQINPMWTYQTKTNDDGEYLFKGLIEGNFLVQVLAGDSSYISEFYQGKYSPDGALSIDVNYHQTKPNIDFYLDKGAKIFGKVINEQTNSPIEGINIYAIDSKGYSYSSQSSTDGTYVINGIPTANQYTLLADASGTMFLSEYYPDKSMDEAPVSVSIENAETNLNIDFSLVQAPEVCGTITCPTFHQLDYCLDQLPLGNYVMEIWDDNPLTISPIKTSAEFSLHPSQILEDMDFEF